MINFFLYLILFQGNGFISRPTLKGLLKEIASDLTDEQLEAAVDEIDEDGSGKIEFEGFEFKNLSRVGVKYVNYE